MHANEKMNQQKRHKSKNEGENRCAVRFVNDGRKDGEERQETIKQSTIKQANKQTNDKLKTTQKESVQTRHTHSVFSVLQREAVYDRHHQHWLIRRLEAIHQVLVLPLRRRQRTIHFSRSTVRVRFRPLTDGKQFWCSSLLRVPPPLPVSFSDISRVQAHRVTTPKTAQY